MFDTLSSKLETTFKWLRNRGKLTEADLDEALKSIRTALLEADVNVKVAKDFCAAVRRRSLGKEIMRSLNPEQTIVKLVYEELVNAMGTQEGLNLRFAPPVVIMLVGLQGSGKTTSAGKLARYLRESLKRRPMLVPADVYRPAAIEQLKTLGRDLNIEVFPSEANQNPVDIAKDAVKYASNAGFDTIVLDTAGRLQIDNQMMDELARIAETVEPHEILLVADAMTGQESVNVAKAFNDLLELDGLILTKLDGDARGGAALSMRAITEKPIKFIGMGEKLDALEVFYPDRLASRILGMGDILSFIEKATKQVDVQEAKKLQKKLKKNEFTIEDFYNQLQNIKKMGSMGSLMQMIPGMGKLAKGIDENTMESELKRVEAIVLSMTKQERQDYEIIDGSRRKRISTGSGTTVEDVNRLLKQFGDMKKMMKKMSKLNPASGMRGFGGLSNLLSGGAKFPGGH